MKFKFLIILLLIITIKANKQLFDALEKESESSNPHSLENQENPQEINKNEDLPSLFLQTNEKALNKKEAATKSLFENKAEDKEKLNNEKNKVSSLFESKEQTNEKTDLKLESKEAASMEIKENNKNVIGNENKTELKTENKTKENSENKKETKTSEKELEQNDKMESKEVNQKTSESSATKVAEQRKRLKKHKRNNTGKNARKSYKKKKVTVQSKKAKKLKNKKTRKYCSTVEEHGRKLRMCGNKRITDKKKQRKEIKEEDSSHESFVEKKITSLHKSMEDLVDSHREINNKINQLELKEKNSSDSSNTKKITDLKKEHKKQIEEIKSKIKKEGGDLNHVFDKNSYSINFLGNQILQISADVEKLKNEIFKINKDLNDSEEKEILSIKAKQATIGGISIDDTQVSLPLNGKILIGKDEIQIKAIADAMNFISFVKHNCGGNFTDCKIVTKEEYEKERADEQEILRRVRKLRRNTEKDI